MLVQLAEFTHATETLYAAYAILAVAATIWVGRTLFVNGRVFLIEACHGKEDLADAINRLLLIGFYLVNFGFVLLWLRIGRRPTTPGEWVEALSFQLGVVIVVLGVLHFINMGVITGMRNRARWYSEGRA